MTIARALLWATGLAVSGFGGWLLLAALSPTDLVWLLLWLVAAIAIHDGVLVPVLLGLRASLRRAARPLPQAVTTLAHLGFVVGGTLTLFVVPEVWAQGRGALNPTLLVGDYALRLGIAWVVIIGAVAIAAVVVTHRDRDRYATVRKTGVRYSEK